MFELCDRPEQFAEMDDSFNYGRVVTPDGVEYGVGAFKMEGSEFKVILYNHANIVEHLEDKEFMYDDVRSILFMAKEGYGASKVVMIRLQPCKIWREIQKKIFQNVQQRMYVSVKEL